MAEVKRAHELDPSKPLSVPSITLISEGDVNSSIAMQEVIELDPNFRGHMNI